MKTTTCCICITNYKLHHKSKRITIYTTLFAQVVPLQVGLPEPVEPKANSCERQQHAAFASQSNTTFTTQSAQVVPLQVGLPEPAEPKADTPPLKSPRQVSQSMLSTFSAHIHLPCPALQQCFAQEAGIITLHALLVNHLTRPVLH